MQVLIEIIGTQKVDREKDKIELTTVGTLEENDGEYILRYKEEQEAPTDAIDVTVVIKKDESLVEMTRTGGAESRLIIESSNRNLCHYGSEYGDILMGISGHSISAEFDGEQGEFEFRYDIDINGLMVSRNSLYTKVRRT